MEYISNDKEKVNSIQLSTVDERIRWGNKLYFAAWTVEIIAALIGLFVAYYQGYDAYTNYQNKDGSISPEHFADVVLGGLPFIMVALAEVLKIPIAYLVYINRNLRTKVFFSVILLFLTFITFETVVSGFERQFTNLTTKVREPTKELNRVVEEIDTLRNNIEKAKKAADSSQAESASNNLSKIMNNLDGQYKKDKKILEGEKKLLDSPEIQSEIKKTTEKINNLKEAISKIDTDIKDLRDERKQKNDATVFTCGKPCLEIDAQIISKKKEKEEKKTKKEELEKKEGNFNSDLSNALAPDKKRITEEINSLGDKLTADKKEAKDEAGKAEALRLSGSKNIKGWNTKVKELEKERSELEGKINEFAALSQIYRFTEYRMQFSDTKVCKTYYEDIKKENVPLSKPENNELGFIPKLWNKFIDIVWGRSNNGLKNITKERQCKEYETKKIKPTEADISTTAFWWYGSLAALVSLMGVVLAFGALILKHPKEKYHDLKSDKHSIRNSIRRLLIALIKRAKTPRKEKKIIKKVVKEVLVDKVVLQDIPVEVVKTEIVHVPLYTSDPDLLKFGTTKIEDVLQDDKKKG